MQIEKKTKILRWSFLLLLLFILLPIILGVTLGKRSDTEHESTGVSKFIYSSCQHTLYPSLCESSLIDSALAETEPAKLLGLSFRVAMAKVEEAHSLARNFTQVLQPPEQHVFSGMDDCAELLEDTLALLNDSINRKNNAAPDDVSTWLSAALTNLDTCIDGIATFTNLTGRDMMKSFARNLSHYISNSLALHEHFIPETRRKLNEEEGKFPSWVNRKLFEVPVGELKPTIVVAMDGSGTYDTVEKAVAAAGSGSVIYVKAGVYSENVVVKRSQTDLVLVGDGKGKTIIVGSRSAGSSWTTFRSATFAVMGNGFVARDITFANDYGSGSQAVALQVSSDRSAIFRCSVLGHQDTLYAHTNRQFYRETDIHGSVDFIFGNAAAVFQSCNILGRKPQPGHTITITAQSRTDPNQNTGFTIQNCRIAPDPVSGGSTAFLGRPWKEYSRVVVMQSTLDGFINPAGWFQWFRGFALDTLFYAEYQNSGAGAGTSGRVRWPGYHASLTQPEAAKFTVAQLLGGTTWLPRTGVAYDPGL